ncbi:AbrB/MazE/SpoVT family DNA-binding domain-containing protein [Halorubrum aidingense]|uniref:AbrB/MazE/SpoVT family DNA-binding domain-containing protein n=1 Tax=Halorubrum aidingense TaxID=368623 RepID=UPI0006777782|nr:AbrB/MazE/SpoVT family DNA-binding domain-containing protein [Halorubrum aidingense]
MGIQDRFADCRTAQEGDGSVTVTIPRPLAEEWEIEQGDQIPFFAEEGSDTAEIRRPGESSK